MLELINQYQKREVGMEVEAIVKTMTKGILLDGNFDIETLEYAIEVKSCRFKSYLLVCSKNRQMAISLLYRL